MTMQLVYSEAIPESHRALGPYTHMLRVIDMSVPPDMRDLSSGSTFIARGRVRNQLQELYGQPVSVRYISMIEPDPEFSHFEHWATTDHNTCFYFKSKEDAFKAKLSVLI